VPYEVVCVAAHKDFDVLKISIERLLKMYSLSEITHFNLIVPENDLDSCLRMFADLASGTAEHRLRVTNENDYFNPQLLELIKLKIPHRYGWVLQQFLKLQAALESSQENILLLDADTVLLRKRNFVDENGSQLLLPTDEYNSSYYENINLLFGIPISKDFSFVSHHLLIQKSILAKILHDSNCGDVADLLKKVLTESKFDSDSPFSIDYELYSQYIVNRCIERVRYERWGNLSLKKSRFTASILNSQLITFLGLLYSSVSIHSWSE